MKKILIVDDEKIITDLLFSALSHVAKYNIEKAYSSIEAKTILEKESFDLLITDWVLADMNGVELCDFAKGKYPHIKTIMMSGYPVTQKTRVKVDEFFPKPFSTHQLIYAISHLIG